MTACVAAVSNDVKPCVVCVADKALTYDNYIVWHSDASKILSISDWGVVLTASDNESHLTWVLEPLKNTRSLSELKNRHQLLQELEEKLRRALDDAKEGLGAREPCQQGEHIGVAADGHSYRALTLQSILAIHGRRASTIAQRQYCRLSETE